MTTRRKILSALLVLVLMLVCLVSVSCNDDTPEVPGKTEWPEAGVYYFDSVVDEYTLTLNVGDTFSLYVKGESLSGSYTLTGKDLVLDFSKDGKENVTAIYEDNVITLTYNGSAMRMLKKISYTVSFNTNGGSAIEAQTVLNGKTVVKPADPTRENYVFVGWYADAEFKTPFEFGAKPVSADATVFAQWAPASTENKEFTAKLDANYDDADVIATLNTYGGQLFDLPTLERTGYTFGGWWFSTEDDGEKLTYKYENGMTLTGDVTLYAFWQQNPEGSKLPAPVVSIKNGTLSWDAISGARAYLIHIINEDGEEVVNANVSATTYNVAFDTLAAGKYEITVTALASTGESNNSESVKYYTNKALDKVSGFSVIGDSMLVYNTVENAEKYLVTVYCANPNHTHENFDNGTSRTFSFANCEMTKDGIGFRVTAVADGFVTSVSDLFTFKRELAQVEGLAFDKENELLTWKPVVNAEAYMVSVKCANADHDHSFVNFGTQTFVSLKECEGAITVKVYPKTAGYISPEAVEYTYSKTSLKTPSGILIKDNTMTWNAVEGAEGYEIKVDDQTFTVTDASFDLSDTLDVVDGVKYTVSIRALGAESSLWSDALSVIYYEMSSELTYDRGTLTWTPVVGADYYEVKVNGGDTVKIENGAFSTAITLTKAGNNTVAVRFADGKFRSEWVQTTVFAHAITFDTVGGSFANTVYLAVGDPLVLPEPTKVGYTFVNWYNLPGGPLNNGRVFADDLFTSNGSIMLYAFYESIGYDVIYDYGVGGNGTATSDKVYFEQNYQLTVPTPADVAGAFGGWYDKPYGMGKKYTDEFGNSLAPWSELDGKTLYAYWIDEALSFSITKVNGRDAYAVSQGPKAGLVTEIDIPETYQGLPVLLISANAFKDCTNLKVINIPETIEQISSMTPFGNCTQLVEINVYDVEGVKNPRFASVDGVLFENDMDGNISKLVQLPVGMTGTYRVPTGITEIPEQALLGASISKVVISSTVVRIGREAFQDCKNLSQVVFEATPADQTEVPLAIGARAFKGCTALEKFTIPARLIEIKLTKYGLHNGTLSTTDVESAFLGCYNLATVNVSIDNKIYKSVNGVIFSKDGKTLILAPENLVGTYEIPAATQTVAAGAFVNCDKLTAVVIPDTVTLVEECAFYEASGLETVTLAGEALQDMTIGGYAFAYCGSLESFVASEQSRLAIISDGVFQNCNSLTKFTFPKTVTYVGEKAFFNCFALNEVEFAEGGKELEFGADAFKSCTSLTTVTIPANVTKIPGIFTGCQNLEEVNVSPDSKYLASEEGVVFDIAKTSILFFPRGKTGTYKLPETLNTIPNGIFANVNKLTALQIPNSVTYIGAMAFSYADIDNIEFYGDTVETKLVIGEKAFNWAKFNVLTLPANTGSLGEDAFYYAKGKKIVLSEGITEIGKRAFMYTRVDEPIVIPASVVTIGDLAFSGNANNATDNYFPKVKLTVEGSQLKTIGVGAFQRNPYITDIVIPASVEEICGMAFYNCHAMTSLVFEEGSQLKTIGARAFEAPVTKWVDKVTYYPLLNCDIVIPKSVSTISGNAFNATCIKSVTFEDGGTEPLILGSEESVFNDYHNASYYRNGSVFANCAYLESVVLPARLTELRANSFYAAGVNSESGLSVSFGAGEIQLATIGNSCFEDAKLYAFTIPASVRNLESAIDTVTESTYDRIAIGRKAFATPYLTSLTFELGATAPLTIGANAFAGTALETLTLPARLDSYQSVTGDVIFALENGAKVFASMSKLASINVEAANGALVIAENNLLMSGDKSVVYFYPAAAEGEVTLPASVTRILDYAFDGCSKMTVLNLSANIVNFNAEMVAGCSALTAINVGADGNGKNYCSIGGVIFTADKSTLIIYPANAEFTELTLPENVKAIAPNAFAGNTKLTKVTLNNGLIEIGSKAFYNTAITEINIPASVQLIESEAFANTSALSTVSFDTNGTVILSIGAYAFANSGVTSVTLPAALYTIGDYAFYNTKNLVTVEFAATGSQLVSIGNFAFALSGVQNITIPEGVKTIGNQAFFKSGVVTVTIGEGVESIGDYAFAGSEDLTSVSFPASLRKLGESVFYYRVSSSEIYKCAKLASATFATGSLLEYLPAATFAETALVTFEVPETVKTMGDGVYNSNGSVKIPGVFYNAKKLTTVTFADNSTCQNIGIGAFDGCTALANVTIAPSVVSISEKAFMGCTKLVSITIPDTVANLGVYAFKGCTALANVTLQTKATELPEGLFDGCKKLTTITLPANVTTLGANCFNGTALAEFKVAESNTHLAVQDGILYNAEKTDILAVPPALKSTVFTVPKAVTKLGDNLFKDNTTLRKVRFETGRTADLEIGNGTFDGCVNLVEIELPEGTTAIGKYAFRNCFRLPRFTIPESMLVIDPTAFYIDPGKQYGYWDGVIEVYNKSGLDVSSQKNGSLGYTAWNIYSDDDGQSYMTITDDGFVIFDDYDLYWDYGYMELVRYIGEETDVVIPEGVEIVTDYAFAGCDFIETITLPKWMERLEESDMGLSYEAFCGCEQAIIIIAFNPYRTEWDVFSPIYNSGNEYEEN